MDTDFWLQKWAKKEIAFHQSEGNPLLGKWIKELQLARTSRVFLPLCGKTGDIAWLLSKGYLVAGAELSELAIEELFLELGIKPKVTPAGGLKHYAGPSIDIFVGDIFDVSATILGPVDAIYDRAALVALPESMRRQYSSHLMRITNTAPQLLICFEYEQPLMAGPPFSIDAKEVTQHYGDAYRLRSLENAVLAGGLRGLSEIRENVWLLLNDKGHLS